MTEVKHTSLGDKMWFLFSIAWIVATAVNSLNWELFPCEWSHPYGSVEKQRLRSQ